MMEHAAKTIGGEVSLLTPSRMHIQPCTGCMACRREGVCRLPEDDAHRAAELLRQADLIVVGTPVYWANMSGPLKVLFDRLVPVFMGKGAHGLPQKKLRGRRGIVVTACTTPFPFDRLFGQSSGAGRAVGEILRAGGVKVRRVRVAGTRGRRHVPPPGALGRMSRLLVRFRNEWENRCWQGMEKGACRKEEMSQAPFRDQKSIKKYTTSIIHDDMDKDAAIPGE